MFTLSPLGQEWQRLTLLDNIGTPFVLGACFLALDPKARLGRTVWAAALLAAAVLVKETNALFLPGVLGALWFGTRGRRRFVYVLFGTLFSGLVAFYPLYALIKGELFEGPGHVSLLWSIKWQLLSRAGSGSALVVGSGSNMAVLGLDDDPEIQHRYPDGWQDVDYVVLTPIMNAVGDEAPSSQAAVRNGTEVARYGDIVIYRVRH